MARTRSSYSGRTRKRQRRVYSNGSYASRSGTRSLGGRSYSSRSSGRSYRGSAINASTVTDQHDIKTQYRRKAMPKRKKRSWIKFSQKVKAVEASGRGSQTLVINDQVITSWGEAIDPTTGNRFQGISEVNIYSVNNDAQGARDKDLILNEVSNYTRTYVGAAGLEYLSGSTIEETRLKAAMMGARIDITYTNTGTYTLELDLYTFTHKNRPSVSDLDAYINMKEAQEGYVALGPGGRLTYESGGTLSTPGSAISLQYRGVTPFQCPGIMKYTGARCLKKDKVLISPGNSVTRSYADNKHKFIFPHGGEYKTRYDKDTITYLAIAKASGNTTDTINTLKTSWTKVYTWTQEGVKVPRSAYFASS